MNDSLSFSGYEKWAKEKTAKLGGNPEELDKEYLPFGGVFFYCFGNYGKIFPLSSPL
jgi:hypothetical protein